mmetsp:Transcript_56805/g.139707  ORF Transcript_56805/g.139707 Transcript_56805/m.139707 type:complete len:104 (-) Transcript_56805:142-453(-)
MANTLILIQPTTDKSSREYHDYESIALGMEGLCEFYESRLRLLHPGKASFSYSASDLFEFIDSVPEIICLTMNTRYHSYMTHSREWIKRSVFDYLKKKSSPSK